MVKLSADRRYSGLVLDHVLADGTIKMPRPLANSPFQGGVAVRKPRWMLASESAPGPAPAGPAPPSSPRQRPPPAGSLQPPPRHHRHLHRLLRLLRRRRRHPPPAQPPPA